MDLWACAIARVVDVAFGLIIFRLSHIRFRCPVQATRGKFKENRSKKPSNLASSLKIASQLTGLMSQSHCLIVPPVVPSCLTVR
jgi:hypothetical protein